MFPKFNLSARGFKSTALVGISAISLLGSQAVLAQTAIGTATTDAAVQLKIDNTSTPRTEALQITGLPAGDASEQVLTIDSAGNVGSVAASAIAGSGGSSSSAVSNLATDNLTQDAEARTYDVNGQLLTFDGGQTVSIGTYIPSSFGIDADFSVQDMNNDGRVDSYLQSAAGQGVFLDSFPSGLSRLSAISGTGNGLATVVAEAGQNAALFLTDGSAKFEFRARSDRHFIESARNGTTSMDFDGGVVTVSGTLNQNSDAKLKTNIQTLEGALDKVSAIRAVRYNWIDTKERTANDQVGVIAQEVQAVLPELVKADGKGTLSVSYPNLAAVAVQAIKELDAKYSEKVASLETENAVLKAQLASFTAQMNEMQVLEAKLERLADRLNAGSSIIEAKLAN